ncbi:YeaC family protein [Larsenimonas rhizosphaerae]|uniref:DUF1315 family protein n=1 Tax=Larsenimonas rhizosphaerae TaxID=2944682 RepID=A0AA41ZFH8_9GAMM|nr:DUF1315 family protein [Larsenimonas rhizosphaerae]MCM2130509.1 YeaC family protein [Larsenimonas rhizosphaerae]MCX2523214.1 DUF1315 family protein [Larsenimonas rhizosphaerae]
MSDMTFEKMIEQMTPEMYQRFKSAIELGRWPDGNRLSREQVGLCMEAVMRYEHVRDIPEKDRIGYIERNQCASDSAPADQDAPIKWMN